MDVFPTRLSEILARILAKAGVTEPDGRPLYAYKTSTPDLEALCVALTGQIQRGRRLDRLAAGALCLFAAETFCRDHSGGVWSWRPIVAMLDYDGSFTDFYPDVVTGLKFWKRRLLPGRQREYLFTLACEGGLPLKIVHKDGGRIRDYLHRLLVLFERYPRADRLELARLEQDRLPSTLRNEEVYNLGTALIEGIVNLRLLVGNRSGPVQILDAEFPTWRDRIALHLDDRVAEELTTWLLARAPVSQEAAPPSVKTLLILEGKPRIERQLKLPPELSAKALASLLQIAEESLPSRGQLNLMFGDERQALAIISSGFDRAGGYRVESFPGVALTVQEAFAEPVYLTLTLSRARQLAACPIEGGAPLPFEMPWVFSDLEEKSAQRLLGVGSVRTRAPSVLILLPQGGQLKDPKSAKITPLSYAVLGRSLIRLQGHAMIITDDDLQYQIETGAAQEDALSYMLMGRTAAIGPKGTTIWHGMPQLKYQDESGMLRGVDPNQLEFIPEHGASRPSRFSTSSIGEGVLRMVRNGVLRYRKRIAIIPAQASFSSRPLRAGAGEIMLRDMQVKDVSIAASSEQGVQANVEPVKGGHRIMFMTRGEPPARADLWLRLTSGNEARICLPFPSVHARFVGRDGAALPLDAEVPLSGLGAIRAEVFTPAADERFSLIGNDHWLAYLVSTEENRFQLPLDSVRAQITQLLASSNINTRVSLTMQRMGLQTGPRVRLRVRLHDAELLLEKEYGPGFVNSVLSLPPDTLHALESALPVPLRLEARPLLDPDAPPLLLQRKQLGAREVWIFPHDGREAGPWLITGWQGGTSRLRPLLITVGSPLPEQHQGLERIGLLAGMRQREAAFHGLLQEMTQDIDHADWPRLVAMARTLGTLPATTFEAVRALARNKVAAVMVLLAAASNDFDAIYRNLEELPFFWHLVSPRDWLRAVRRLHAAHVQCAKEGGLRQTPEQLTEERLGGIVERLAIWHPAHPVLATFLMRGTGSGPVAALSGGREDDVRFWREFKRLRGELLSRHAEDSWPIARIARESGAMAPERKRCLENQPGFQHDILIAPYEAAYLAISEKSLPDEHIVELRLLRTFDEEWFDRAYALALQRFVTDSIMNDPEFFHV